MKHWLIHLFVDDFFFMKEVYDKCRNFLHRWQATVILYLLTTPFGHSISVFLAMLSLSPRIIMTIAFMRNGCN